MPMNKQETEIFKALAGRYMELATLPVQKEKRDLWKALNRFQMKRPMVVIDQLPGDELAEGGELDCKISDPFWRRVEFELRFQIYRFSHFPVDMVLEPFITIPKSVQLSGFGIEIDEDITEAVNGVSGHHYRNQIETMEDVQKIKDLTVAHNEEESALHLAEAKSVLDGYAPTRLGGGVSFHLGVWDKLSMLMGVEDVYYMLIDQPEILHAAMRRITNATIAGIKAANALQVVNDNANTCHCSYLYDDDLLPDFNGGKGSVSQNSWGYGMAQLFTSVSPAVTEEFELPYITDMANYFGKIYYGCCDRLDDRLDIIKRIPHVQKVSCSPWSDRRAFAEKIGRNLVMSNKPSPAYLATEIFDEDVVRRDLMETVKAARDQNVNLEIILKDISTVRHQPERLTRWGEIAMEIVNGI